MNEFISKLTLVDGYKFIDDDTRVLLLLEASDFENFSALQIERNFFTFTKNSSYIFKFFSELSAELYDINALKDADVYGEYEEHITILTELYKRYETLCNERKFLDKIFLPKLYTFNKNFLKNHKKIEIRIEGHLTNFEFKLLQECVEYSSIVLHFNSSRFNQKMQNRFKEFGLEIENNYSYIISLNNKEIVSKTKIIANKNVSCESFSEALLEVAFVKKKIYEFVKKGYKPENIAVVLPDESKAQFLQSFDEKSNLNLAMGVSFTQSEIYTKLMATTKVIDLDSKENMARISRIGNELYVKLFNIYYKKASEVDFIGFLEEIKELFENKSELKIFEEEIFSFRAIAPFMKEMSIKSLLNLFMQRLATRTMDDVRGGKVTVMGVLETRAVKFDGVIIIDFDDANVPKRSDKDMFLNSAIREMANLPTMSDRENLQKHYYSMLINSSKEVAMAYVSSEQNRGSRFLKQLGIIESKTYDESALAKILFESKDVDAKSFEDRVIEYSFKDVKLSSTRLKTFLTCKRKYFYKYIQNINQHSIPTDMPEEYEIGNAVHLALKELYSKQNSYSDANKLKHDLNKELDRVEGTSELDKYLIAIQKRLLEKFSREEVKRFSQGWHVAHTEELFEVPFHGLTLVGYIDRIDKRENEVTVLDYKTGSYPLYTQRNYKEATDFQLEFYYLLASGVGNIVSCAYYDLKESKRVEEQLLDEKLELLKAHLKKLLEIQEIDTKQCEDTKHCLYCEYQLMCGR